MNNMEVALWEKGSTIVQSHCLTTVSVSNNTSGVRGLIKWFTSVKKEQEYKQINK